MTAVTIHSNQTVLNGVKGNQALLEPSYRKNQMNFLATQYMYYILHSYSKVS